ncbi:MAG: hypothetical protein ABIV26_03675 [Candidatus Limnocylindrales bacterium]
MTRVLAIILHAVPGADAGPLELAFAVARLRNAERQARGFAAAGADARISAVEAGGLPFGARLRELAATNPNAGIVILGSGSIPLATASDRGVLVAAARGERHAFRTDRTGPPRVAGPSSPGKATAPAVALTVLVNNRYSADVLAIPLGIDLTTLPDLASDNGVPHWLEGRGIEVADLRRRSTLQVDLDSPLDVALAGGVRDMPGIADRLGPLRTVAAELVERSRDPGAQLLVAGRTSAATLRWLERHTASRTRALVEERGFRTAAPGQRSPRSTLGLLLDRDGPAALGSILAGLADAAIVDSRVLLAHRLGADETDWPRAEDRFASDLLLAGSVTDPWLGELTASAASASIPILLGGHTLVGPGLPAVLRGALA